MQNIYKDENCIFILTVNEKFERKTFNKNSSIKWYEKLLNEFPNEKVCHFKILKSVFKEYKKTFDYKILVNNSIIG